MRQLRKPPLPTNVLDSGFDETSYADVVARYQSPTISLDESAYLSKLLDRWGDLRVPTHRHMVAWDNHAERRNMVAYDYNNHRG